jgi:hypothetical protein
MLGRCLQERIRNYLETKRECRISNSECRMSESKLFPLPWLKANSVRGAESAAVLLYMKCVYEAAFATTFGRMHPESQKIPEFLFQQ